MREAEIPKVRKPFFLQSVCMKGLRASKLKDFFLSLECFINMEGLFSAQLRKMEESMAADDVEIEKLRGEEKEKLKVGIISS